LKTKLTITYLNDSETKVEALLEMPSNPDLVISKLKIKVGDSQEITAVVKDKEKAREQYDDAIAGGH
jgi:Vault protein inter-alpha-trypsin domain